MDQELETVQDKLSAVKVVEAWSNMLIATIRWPHQYNLLEVVSEDHLQYDVAKM